jgi:hypothetical protein
MQQEVVQIYKLFILFHAAGLCVSNLQVTFWHLTYYTSTLLTCSDRHSQSRA